MRLSNTALRFVAKRANSDMKAKHEAAHESTHKPPSLACGKTRATWPPTHTLAAKSARRTTVGKCLPFTHEGRRAAASPSVGLAAVRSLGEATLTHASEGRGRKSQSLSLMAFVGRGVGISSTQTSAKRLKPLPARAPSPRRNSEPPTRFASVEELFRDRA